MRFLSRKFWLTVLGMAQIGVLQWYGKLDAASATAISGLVAGYMGLNVVQKRVEAP